MPLDRSNNAEPATSFDDLVDLARGRGARRLVVVGAAEQRVLTAVSRAAQLAIAAPVLLDDVGLVRAVAEEHDIALDGCEIVDMEDLSGAALLAMEWVRAGEVAAVMKGRMSTPELMRIGLRNGLRREGRLLSHVSGFEHQRFGRMILFTDGALVPFPSVSQRVEIIKNAVETMRALGVGQPRVAVLSSSEEVDEKIPVSLAAHELKQMNRPGGALDGWGMVDGPLDLFSALDARAAQIKGVGGDVAGRADVLHCPDVVAGNLMGKAMIYFAEGSRTGGCVVGGSVPLILLSRASSADDKFCSIVLGLTAAVHRGE